MLRGVDFDVAPGQHLRPARLERGGQDHGRAHPGHPAARPTRAGRGARLRRRHPGGRRAASRSASPGSSRRSTRSSPGARTWCSWRACGTCRMPGAIADALLARFQLTDAADRKVSTYSGGMRRRLDIAMSLIGDPPVVFLDEPTTGLDPEARLEVWQAVRDLAASGTTVLLTTQYLDEAEQLADRIAILHGGRIIENGTLAELKALLPPAKVEYVEKQPTLEDVFLALVGHDGTAKGPAMTTHFVGDTALLTGRSLRHITRSLDTIITTTIMPIAFLLLFVFVFGGAIDTGIGLVRRLPAARHPDHHRRLGCLLHGVPALPRPAERDLRAVPLHADRPVARCCGRTCSPRWPPSRCRSWSSCSPPLVMGFRSGAGVLAWLAVAGILAPVHPGADLARRHPGPDGEVRRRCERVLLPADPAAVHQLRLRAHRARCPARCGPSPRTSRSPPSSTPSATCSPGSRSAPTSGSPSPGASASSPSPTAFAMLAYRRRLA